MNNKHRVAPFFLFFLLFFYYFFSNWVLICSFFWPSRKTNEVGELTGFNLHLSERLDLLFSFFLFFFFCFTLPCLVFFPSCPASASNTDDLLRFFPRSVPQKDHGNDTNRSAVFEALGGTVLKLLAFRVIFILIQITCSWLSGLNLVVLFLKD